MDTENPRPSDTGIPEKTVGNEDGVELSRVLTWKTLEPKSRRVTQLPVCVGGVPKTVTFEVRSFVFIPTVFCRECNTGTRRSSDD